MLEIHENEIVPRLLELHPVSAEQLQAMEKNPDHPFFTLVFDREGYSPAFFNRLWVKHRIAVLTYRKNVKEQWYDAGFEEMQVKTRLGKLEMKLQENRNTIDGCSLN